MRFSVVDGMIVDKENKFSSELLSLEKLNSKWGDMLIGYDSNMPKEMAFLKFINDIDNAGKSFRENNKIAYLLATKHLYPLISYEKIMKIESVGLLVDFIQFPMKELEIRNEIFEPTDGIYEGIYSIGNVKITYNWYYNNEHTLVLNNDSPTIFVADLDKWSDRESDLARLQQEEITYFLRYIESFYPRGVDGESQEETKGRIISHLENGLISVEDIIGAMTKK